MICPRTDARSPQPPAYRRAGRRLGRRRKGTVSLPGSLDEPPFIYGIHKNTLLRACFCLLEQKADNMCRLWYNMDANQK